MPTVPAGNETVVIPNGAVILMDRDLVAVTAALSVTLAVNVAVPVVVGVPEMTPVAGASVKPAGKEPELMVQL